MKTVRNWVRNSKFLFIIKQLFPRQVWFWVVGLFCLLSEEVLLVRQVRNLFQIKMQLYKGK